MRSIILITFILKSWSIDPFGWSVKVNIVFHLECNFNVIKFYNKVSFKFWQWNGDKSLHLSPAAPPQWLWFLVDHKEWYFCVGTREKTWQTVWHAPNECERKQKMRMDETLEPRRRLLLPELLHYCVFKVDHYYNVVFKKNTRSGFKEKRTCRYISVRRITFQCSRQIVSAKTHQHFVNNIKNTWKKWQLEGK